MLAHLLADDRFEKLFSLGMIVKHLFLFICPVLCGVKIKLSFFIHDLFVLIG